MNRVLGCALAAVLTGCAEQPPPVSPGLKLADAPAWAMKPAEPIKPIPENDGDLVVRRDWYGQELQGRGQCHDRLGALQLYIRKVRE